MYGVGIKKCTNMYKMLRAFYSLLGQFKIQQYNNSEINCDLVSDIKTLDLWSINMCYLMIQIKM